MSYLESPQRISERNLVFAAVALERGALRQHEINHAFTLWICDKTRTLGDILLERKVLTEAQRQELELAVEEKLAQEKNSGEALGSMESLDDLSSQLHILLDSDLDQSLSRARKEKTTAADFSRKIPQKETKGEKSSSAGAEEHLSDRFEPIDYLPSQGGMGELWIARDKELNRYVVMKFIKRFRANDPLSRGLFHLEGEVTGHLEHPNIPPVYSLGKDPFSRDFYAMRYFKGKKLTEAIREYHALPHQDRESRKEKLVELLQTFQAACLTVEFAHHHGVIHCDLKPDNIMLGPYGETLVIDWGLVIVKAPGLAADHDLPTEEFRKESQSTFQPSKTAASGLHEKQGGSRETVGGTLQYMPPEQLRASETKEIDQISFASDVFGLGATLYHLLCGKAPYLPNTKEKETRTQYFDRIRLAEFPLPRTIRPDIPRPLESIVKKAMQADPKQRYGSARELAGDVRRWLIDEPVRVHPQGISEMGGRWLRRNRKPVAVGALLLFASLLIGGILIWKEQQKTQRYANRALLVANNGFRMVETIEPLIASDVNFDLERRKILIDSARAYEEIFADFLPDNRTKAMAAQLFRFAANSHRYHFEVSDAERLYKLAISVYQDLILKYPNDDQFYFRLALIYVDYGQLYVAMGQWEEARRLTEMAQKEVEKTNKSKALNPGQARVDGIIFLALAGISHSQDLFDQSAAEAAEALNACNRLKSIKVFKGYDYIMHQGSLTLIGMNLREKGQFEESTKLMEDARNVLNPMNEELKSHDQNIVRDIAKIDLLQSYINCKLEQNLSLIRAKKNLDKVGPSLDSVVVQANSLSTVYPENPRLRLLLSSALAVRGNYHLNSTTPEKSAADFKKSKEISNNLISQYPEIASIKLRHQKFIEKMEVK